MAASAFFPTRFIPPEGQLSLRAVVALCLAVGLGCAAAVFILLAGFDQRYPVSAVHDEVVGSSLPQAAVPQTAQIEKSQMVPAGPERPVVAVRHLEPRALEFTVVKSKHFQTVGPIQIAVWRTDAKHASARMTVVAGGRRVEYKKVLENERLFIPSSKQVLELSITRITKTDLVGTWTEITGREGRRN